MSVLSIRDLTVRFDSAEGEVRAVEHFSLTVEKGECIGVVGESGSGKSQTFLAAMGLLAGKRACDGQCAARRAGDSQRAPPRAESRARQSTSA